jgi:hypothetical protein
MINKFSQRYPRLAHLLVILLMVSPLFVLVASWSRTNW